MYVIVIYLLSLLQYIPLPRQIKPSKTCWHLCRPDYITTETILSVVNEVVGVARPVCLNEYEIECASLSLLIVENPDNCAGDINLIVARNPGRGIWRSGDAINLHIKVSQHEHNHNIDAVKENLRCSIRALLCSYYASNNLSTGWIKW